MEKESVKKFDLEAAFKALDEIEIPQTKGIKANRVDLKERFGHKPATETLVEDYYDVSSTEDLKDAKEERDGEIAKAKLARIEKIVDLNAESPEDLLPSYVGKVIMQCPQCMTLFYKNPEDIEPSEENPDVVNLNEPCQHCGNTSGYTLIGKVGAVSEDEADKYDETPTEENELDLDFDKGTEEVDAEGTGEGAEEMSDEETKEESSDETSSDDDLDLDLNLDEVSEEEPEEEKKEESLNLSKETSEDETEHKSENLTLNEEVDKDLDEKLKAHNDYIAYLQQMIKQEEEALKKAENDEIKAAIQRRLDAFNADLEAALPDAVKAEVSIEEPTEEETPAEEEKVEEPAEETAEEKAEEEAPVDEALTNKTEECKVVLSDKPEKEVFAGTKEECEKIIEKNKETKTAKEHGLKIVEPAADENKTEEKSEKSALKESVESEIDSIIASWGVNEGLIKEDESMPLRSIEVKDKENSRKGISWQVFYGEKDSLHKEFKNEEEAKKFAAENNGKLMPLRSTEESLKFKTTDKLCSVVLNGRQYFAGTKEECEKFIKDHESEEAAKELGGYKLLNTAGIYVDESLKFKTTDKLCSVVLNGRQYFAGTKEECEKFIKDHESEEAAKELGGYKLLNTAGIYVDESLKFKTTDKLCSVVLNGRQYFAGTKEECEKFIKDHESEEAAKELGGYKLLNTAGIYVDESLKFKTTDKLCSVVLNGRQYFAGTKEECEKFIKDYELEEAAKELGGYKLLNTAGIYVDESLKFKTTDKLCSVVLNGRQYFAGTKEECEKFIKDHESEEAAKELGGYKLLNTAGIYVDESLTEEGDLDRLLDSDEFKTPVSEEEINAARREVAKESLEEKCGKQKITEESDSEIAAIINSWEDTPEVPVEESCEGPECESKEECDDCLKEEKEDESEVEENDDDSEEVCFTTEEVKEVATDVAQSLATPVEDKKEAEKQAEEISEVVDEKVDKAIEEKAEEADEDEEAAEEDESDKEDKSDDEKPEEETEGPEFNEDDIDELDECSLNKHIDEYLKEVYSNVKSYETTDCELKEGKLIVEGKISFNSGKEKLTMFEFLPAYCEGKLFFEGYNKDFSEDKAFKLNCSINESKTLITESFGYKYKINENLVEGLK